MPVNEKRILEKILTLEVATSVVARELSELKKEFSQVPQVSSKRADLNRRIEEAWIKKEKRLNVSIQRRFQTQ